MKAKKSSRMFVNRAIRKNMKFYSPIFMGPTVLAFIIGFVWPFLWGIYLSFYQFKTFRFRTFVGFSNYVEAIKDPSFARAFWFTCLFTITSVVIINIISFALAYALTSKIKGSTIFRTIFFMPNLVGGIVLAYVWQQIMNRFIYLVFNSQLLLESKFGFWGLIIVVCWQQIGYMMIIYIAGLQNVPSDYIEAAKMDGANGWQVLGRIILPTVMPSISICLFLSLTNGFKLFDQNLALTNGFPDHKTEMLALNIYNSFSANNSNLGIGQAKAVIFFLLVVFISLSQLAITRRKEVQA